MSTVSLPALVSYARYLGLVPNGITDNQFCVGVALTVQTSPLLLAFTGNLTVQNYTSRGDLISAIVVCRLPCPHRFALRTYSVLVGACRGQDIFRG